MTVKQHIKKLSEERQKVFFIENFIYDYQISMSFLISKIFKDFEPSEKAGEN